LIEITLLADESYGVRSMCTFVETPDINILLDAGVSLAPRRFGYPPHPFEFDALRKARERIIEFSELADIVTLSHYHLDHYTPPHKGRYEWTDENTYKKIYGDKIVLAKNFQENINFHQSKRGYIFNKYVSEIAYKLHFVDAKNVKIGNTILSFSPPLPHGLDNTKLGYVLLLTIEHGRMKIMFAPDVQGPISERVLQYIVKERPMILIIGGPPIYLMGSKFSEQDINKGLSNLVYLIRKSFIKKIIVSHHFLRDINWRRELESRLEKKYFSKIYTSAEYNREENLFLEGVRDKIWKDDPPKKEFLDWLKNRENFSLNIDFYSMI